MKNYIIVAVISAIVSIFTWEAMHVITGADADSQKQTSNEQFIWRNPV